MAIRSLLFIGPVLTASGYGVHARQVLKAVVDSGNYDVYVDSLKWGETSFLTGPEFSWIEELVAKRAMAGDRKFDISVQVTIPNEFRRCARLNIGVTAGIEVDRVSPAWILKSNEEVDLLVVPSQHSRDTFVNTRYQTQDGQVLGLQVPIFVVPEAVSPRYHFQLQGNRCGLLPDDVPSQNLLVVGLGLDKPLGEDRKNISNTILWFLREFKDRQDVGLVLKVNIVNYSIFDLDMTKRRIRELREAAGALQYPQITLLHGRLTDQQMAELYCDDRITALVSLTHGEGFGLPLLEATTCGLPVVATDWSGHKDFLHGPSYIPVAFELKEIPQTAVWDGVMERGSRWANVSEEAARKAMCDAFEFGSEELATPIDLNAKNLAKRNVDDFSQRSLQERFVSLTEDAWEHVVTARPETREEVVAAVRKQLNVPPGRKTLLYTMPMSGGDVYLSTAVVKALREKHTAKQDLLSTFDDILDSGAHIAPGLPPVVFFATKPQYRSILEGNPDIDHVVDWQPWMQDVGLLEDIFDDVYTPNLAIQMQWSNWVHRGKGRNLFHEMAVQCGIPVQDLGGPQIGHVPVAGLPQQYIVIHTGSGKGQWGARKYNQWQDVVDNIKKYSTKKTVRKTESLVFESESDLHAFIDSKPNCVVVSRDSLGKYIEVTAEFDFEDSSNAVEIVQVGLTDEPPLRGTVDFRGKTPDYRQLAYIVQNSKGVVSIDSLVMHLAAHHGRPHVALFGGSYAKTTGTAYGELEAFPGKSFMSEAVKRCLIEADDRLGCDRACYKNECRVNPDSPCINTIKGQTVVEHVFRKIFDDERLGQEAYAKYEKRRPTISGYTHVYNAKTHGYPFVESVRSMLGFCTEVVVIDGGSTDGTVEDIRAIGDDRVKLIENRWDPEEPGMDGMQKAFGRVMCDPSAEFLWQQDCDEIVHEEDYEKVLEVARNFPSDASLLHLPIIELWGDTETVRTDRHAWKWRMSRNEFQITHGIVKHARVVDQKTGRVHAKPGMSDGCEYIDVMTGEYVQHKGFWNSAWEEMRQKDPAAYGNALNALARDSGLPVVFHYSWADLPRKVRNFRDFWDNQWSVLHQQQNAPRFPDVKSEEDVISKAVELKERGGEHGAAPTFKLERSNPAVMASWIEKMEKV